MIADKQIEKGNITKGRKRGRNKYRPLSEAVQIGKKRSAQGKEPRADVKHSRPTSAPDPFARVAAVHGVDYLLTWNCTHIANVTLRPRIEAVCRAAGYEPPLICTPEELPAGGQGDE